MPDPEPVTWEHYKKGLLNWPVNIAKASVNLIYSAIVIGILVCVAFTVIYFGKQTIWKQKPQPQPVTITAPSGKVFNATEVKKDRWSLVNIFSW